MGDCLATIDMGRKEGAAVPFSGGGAGSPSNTMWRGPRSTSVLSGILIHPAVWSQQTWAENWGGLLCPFGGELGPHLTQCGLGRGLPPYHTRWHFDASSPFGHNRHGPKVGDAPLFLGGELGAHLTQRGRCRGLPLYQVSPRSIQPFGHNIPTLPTDVTDRQTGRRSDSIGRTVLQTVAQQLATFDK